MEAGIQSEDEVRARKLTRQGAIWAIISGIGNFVIGGESFREILYRRKSLEPPELAMMGFCLLVAPFLIYRGIQVLRFVASDPKPESQSLISQ
jgi:hypothetical protein